MSHTACCEPPKAERENPPGQPALRYRTGTWATFRAAMVAQLPHQKVVLGPGEESRPLQALTSRDPSDPTIALLDATACALDVLTFYQERHLNEGFLGTATERVSLVQMARALGYEPAPGLAASGYLAFTVSPTTVEPVAIPAGTAVMAMPEGSSPPPIFETSEEIEARAVHNALPVTKRLPITDLVREDDHVWVEGVATRAQRGDGVLLYGPIRTGNAGSERWDFRRLTEVVVDTERSQTKLVFERGLGDEGTAPPARPTAVLIFRNRASLFGHNAPDWKLQSDQIQLTAWWSAGHGMAGVPAEGTDGRTRLLSRTNPVTQWPKFGLPQDPAVKIGCLDLDREYTGIVPGSWVVLADAYLVEAYQVQAASPRAREDFTLTSKVTRLKLRGEHLGWFDRRGTTVWCEPDPFERVGEPDRSPVTGATVSLVGSHEDLLDRMLAVYGPDDADGSPRGEVVRVSAAVVGSDGTTTLTLDPPLASSYARDAVVINANLVRATHGKAAAQEVLGSGDPTAPFQRFVLKGRPLTHVSSPEEASGAAAELTVRVGGVAWTRVPFLYGQAPDALVYSLRHSSDGTTVVELGDGITGARLPPGIENVVATYRTGLGTAGEVARGKATLLTRRPAGVDAAINPTPFSGAADPETIDQIRQNAPSTVLTLDRLVSIQDYEDFARTFAGIGKALAVGLWEGQRRLVHLTIASASGKPLAPTDPVFVDLGLSIAGHQDPVHRAVIDSYDEAFLGVEASLLIDPAYVWEDLEAAARAALASALSFERRRFGQGVTPAEVLTILQSVDGVRAVDLDRIFRTDNTAVAAPPQLLLEARGPQTSGGVRQTAELLLLSANEADVLLKRMSE
ncbi:MAG: putative baseplate assembly protein [Polyangiaceae bacterium]